MSPIFVIIPVSVQKQYTSYSYSIDFTKRLLLHDVVVFLEVQVIYV